MHKTLIKLLIFLTISACIGIWVVCHFFYYSLHLLAQPLSPAEHFTNSEQYDFIVTDANVYLPAWNSTEGLLYLDIYNAGTASTSTYCDTSITLVDVDSEVPTMIAVETDTRTWKPGTSTHIEIPLDLTVLNKGTYYLYFNIWDETKKAAVELDNTFRLERNGYYIGLLSISNFGF